MMIRKQEFKRERGKLAVAHNDYRRGLNLYALSKLRNRMISEDLVQDTFTKAWSYLVKGGQIKAMRPFLYHILDCLIVDEYRKRKTISLDILIEKGFEPSAGDFQTFFRDLDSGESILLIRRLPEKYQRVVSMRYLQELSLQEISFITGESKNTIAVQAHRGLQKLKLAHKSNSANRLA